MPGYAIVVRPHPDRVPYRALFEVGFQGFQAGAELTVGFWEIRNRTADKPEGDKRQLGAISGKLERAGGSKESPLFGLKPDTKPAEIKPEAGPAVGFVMTPGGRARHAFPFLLQFDVEQRPEGETWELQVTVAAPKLASPCVPVVWPRFAVASRGDEPSATYDWHAGNDVRLFNDASEDARGSAGAFHEIVESIRQAKHFVFVVDWSFHPLMRPIPSAAATLDETIGALLVERARAGVVVAIHTWLHSGPAADDQNNRALEILKTIAARTGDKSWPKTLFWRAGYREIATTHHQKFVALDWDGKRDDGRREVRTFYGGLDLTKGRFDWPGHPILAADPGDPKKANPEAEPFLELVDYGGRVYTAEVEADDETVVDRGDDWYNAELLKLHMIQSEKPAKGGWKLRDLAQIPPRQPWHDIHARVTGPAAWDFVREFVGRWNITTSWGVPIPVVGSRHDFGDKGGVKTPQVQEVLFKVLADREKFVQQWEPGTGPFAAQMLRSMVRGHWHDPTKNPAWHPDREEFRFRVPDFERSIQDSYLRAIARAQRFIYIETQYLIGSGALWSSSTESAVANRIPETIVARILERAKKAKPFHCYVLIPMYPEGDPASAAALAIRRYEWETMRYMIRTLDQALKKDKPKASWTEYLSFYFLGQWHDTGGKLRVNDKKDEDHPPVSRLRLMNENKRHMIYIHSKLMIVDDRYVIVGSANLNERSLAGNRDTEDCVAVWPSGPATEKDCVTEIRRFRGRLWDEHLGSDKPGNWDKPEEASCASAVRKAGEHNWKEFRTGKRTGDGHLVALPFQLGEEGWFSDADVPFQEFKDAVIPDGYFNQPDPADMTDADWRWDSPGRHLVGGTSLPE